MEATSQETTRALRPFVYPVSHMESSVGQPTELSWQGFTSVSKEPNADVRADCDYLPCDNAK